MIMKFFTHSLMEHGSSDRHFLLLLLLLLPLQTSNSVYNPPFFTPSVAVVGMAWFLGLGKYYPWMKQNSVISIEHSHVKSSRFWKATENGAQVLETDPKWRLIGSVPST